jgi:Flp pilus assembly protein TadB
MAALRIPLLVLGAFGASLCWLLLTALSVNDVRGRMWKWSRRIGWVAKQRLGLRQADLAWIPWWGWFAGRVLAPMVVALVAYLFFHIAVLGALAALAIHHILGLLLELRRRRAEASRQAALLDAIRYGAAMMARAGNALQMVTALATTGPFEARRVFRNLVARTVGENALSLSAAAGAEQELLADPLFDDFALALTLHSQHGGRLVPALDALVSEWDESLRLQREAKAMRAGIEASVLLLSLLPFAFLVILQALGPSLLEPFKSVTGEILLGLAVAWMVVGYRVLQSMSASPREERLTLARTR